MNNKGKILVVYFSKTGHSKHIAEYIARLIDCDIEMIKPQRDISNFMGQAIEAFLSSIGKGSKIYPSDVPVSKYENIIICCPIWCSNLPAPILTYLDQRKERFKNLNLILSSSKFDDEKIITKIEQKFKINISNHLFITNKDRIKGSQIKMVAGLIEKIKFLIKNKDS
jgi:flavodoxin